MNQVQKQYDLQIRTATFGKRIIALCLSILETAITRPLISQLVRSSTSIGANYMEATCASSKKDFRNKVFITKKEAQESKHWLIMISDFVADQTELNLLNQECMELILIFQAITKKLDQPKIKT